MIAHAPPGVGIQSSQASRTITCTCVLLVGSWCTIQSLVHAPSRASKRMASVGREFWQLLLIRDSGFGSFPAGCNSWRTSQTVHDLPSLEGTWSFNFMTPSSAFLQRNCRTDYVLPSITRLLKVHEICSLKGETLSFLPASTCTPCKAPQCPHSSTVQVT